MKQTIFISELPPGLNGSDGLQQIHWAKYQALKKDWVWFVRAENPDKHEGRVSIHYTRVSVRMMDFDNIAASFKVVGDALEANDIIKDDSPRTISRFEVRWEKADSRKAQGVRVEIEDVE